MCISTELVCKIAENTEELPEQMSKFGVFSVFREHSIFSLSFAVFLNVDDYVV